jgi:alkanesulfonate monooxygenase SsuD/methylene tetrahydromethanopterin reductase-like flavin-dependent oxidoreductase (luciferase family)
VRPMDHTQHDVPIYLAAIGPKNVQLAAEIADGLLPIMWSPTRWRSVYPADIFEGAKEGFDLAPTVWTAVGDDLAACRDVVRRHIAFYVGAMGPPGNNYYADLVRRYGYEETVDQVTACYVERRAGEAAGFVPDELVDELGLVGPRGHLAEQLERWRDSPVGTLIVEADDPMALEILAELTQ